MDTRHGGVYARTKLVIIQMVAQDNINMAPSQRFGSAFDCHTLQLGGKTLDIV